MGGHAPAATAAAATATATAMATATAAATAGQPCSTPAMHPPAPATPVPLKQHKCSPDYIIAPDSLCRSRHSRQALASRPTAFNFRGYNGQGFGLLPLPRGRPPIAPLDSKAHPLASASQPPATSFLLVAWAHTLCSHPVCAPATGLLPTPATNLLPAPPPSLALFLQLPPASFLHLSLTLSMHLPPASFLRLRPHHRLPPASFL